MLNISVVSFYQNFALIFTGLEDMATHGALKIGPPHCRLGHPRYVSAETSTVKLDKGCIFDEFM